MNYIEAVKLLKQDPHKYKGIRLPTFDVNQYLYIDSHDSKNSTLYWHNNTERCGMFIVHILSEDWSMVLNKKTEVVKLNNEYDAVVSSDGKIKVGCQEFDFSVIDKLYNAMSNVRVGT